MPKRIEIIFESLPPSELYPNRLRSIHWSVRSRIEAQARQDAFYLAKEAMSKIDWQMPGKAKVYFEFTAADKRKRDLDGLVSACKPFLDGLVDARAIPSDDCWTLEIGGAIIKLGDKPQAKLIIVGVK